MNFPSDLPLEIKGYHYAAQQVSFLIRNFDSSNQDKLVTHVHACMHAVCLKYELDRHTVRHTEQTIFKYPISFRAVFTCVSIYTHRWKLWIVSSRSEQTDLTLFRSGSSD